MALLQDDSETMLMSAGQGTLRSMLAWLGVVLVVPLVHGVQMASGSNL